MRNLANLIATWMSFSKIMNKQTQQIIDWLELSQEEEIRKLLGDVQEQAFYNASMKLKRYVFGLLMEEVKNCSGIVTDFITHCLTLVAWEEVAKYFLAPKYELKFGKTEFPKNKK